MGDPTVSARVFKSSVVTVLALLTSIAAGLYLLPFLISHLGDHWYGTWVYIGSLFFYFTLLDFGLFSASERYVTFALANDDSDEANDVLSTCLVLFSFAGLLALAAGLGAALLAPVFVPDPESLPVIRTALIVLALDAGLFFPGSLLNGIIVARIRYDLAGVVQILKIALRTGLIIYFVGQGYSIVAIAVIQLATNLLERGLKALIAFRLFPALSFSLSGLSRQRVSKLASYGFYSFVAEVGDKARFHTDVLVIGAFLTASSVTLYNIAIRIIHYYAQALTGALNVLLPVFTADIARGDMEEVRRRLAFATKLAVAGTILSAGLLWLLAEPFIGFWIGRDYSWAAVPLTILLFGIIVELGQIPASILLFALARQRFLAQIGLVEGIANLVLTIVLVKPFGLIGVALGTSVPLVLLRGIGLPIYVCRCLQMPLRDYLANIFGLLVPAAAFQVPVHLAFLALPDLVFTARLPLAIGAYGLIGLLVMRVGFSQEERSAIWNVLWRQGRKDSTAG